MPVNFEEGSIGILDQLICKAMGVCTFPPCGKILRAEACKVKWPRGSTFGNNELISGDQIEQALGRIGSSKITLQAGACRGMRQRIDAAFNTCLARKDAGGR